MTGWLPILKVLLLNSLVSNPLTFFRHKLNNKYVMYYIFIKLFSPTEMSEVLEMYS